jgi:hypothetical protein
VFDNETDLAAAELELVAQGIQTEIFDTIDAQNLREPAHEAGITGKLKRGVTNHLGGETHMAERYARYLDEGSLVVAAKVPDSETAIKVAQAVTQHGGYEVTYFRDWAIQYMSPTENIAHGVSTHSNSNLDE